MAKYIVTLLLLLFSKKTHVTKNYNNTFLFAVISQKNVTGIVIGSVVGILIFIGIVCAIIYIRRKYHNKR